MNKILKYGLYMQIPNLILIMIITLSLIITSINWNWFINNLGIIILGTIFVLINIFSLILIFVGLMENNNYKATEEIFKKITSKINNSSNNERR
jgi:hypothetical protein